MESKGCRVRVNGLKGLVSSMERVQRQGLLAILPAYKTTSTESLQFISSIPPVRIQLDQIRYNASLRMSKMDPNHPIILRAYSTHLHQHLLQSPPPLDATTPPVQFDQANLVKRRKRPKCKTTLQDTACIIKHRPPQLIS